MQTLPQNIHLGMKVVDSRHKTIGKVDDLRFPENAIDPEVEPADIDGADKPGRNETILGAVAEAFGREELPEALRDRLLREGYIRLDTPLGKDRYILPAQIASASNDEVMLNVDKDELIKRQ
jgi:hypothetical protein